MIVIPAVDLRDGRMVHQVRGGASNGRAPRIDPSDAARSLGDWGFERLHLVDFDVRPKNGSTAPALEEIVRETDAKVQVAGANSGSAVEQLFRSGADYAVLGSRAIEEPDWLSGIVDLYPDAILVATDVRDRRVVRRGWVRTLPLDILDVVDELNALPLAGLLIGGLHLDRPSRAADLGLVEDVVERSRVPVIVSVHVGGVNDLRALEHRGAAGAILEAEQLLTGALDARSVAREFGT